MGQFMWVIHLAKQESRYTFLFQDQDLPTFLQVLGRYAADPEYDFTWYDAAVLSQKARQLVDKPKQ